MSLLSPLLLTRSGLYFGGKTSSYFSVGKITEEQVKSYAARKQMPLDDMVRWLGPALSYNP